MRVRQLGGRVDPQKSVDDRLDCVDGEVAPRAEARVGLFAGRGV